MKHNYRIFGEKPVEIVVEMGLGSCLSEWNPIVKLLQKNCGVLVYERAGINKSEPSSRKRTPENIAAELFELLKTINHADQIILIAHSQGGLYAQQFCRLYPDFVKRLILLDPLSASDGRFKASLTEKEYKQSGVDKSSNFKTMEKLAKLKLGGISKLLLRKAPPFYYYNGFTKEETADILGCASNAIHAATALQEYICAHEPANIASLNDGNGFPDVPLVLITHSSELAIKESMEFGRNSREFATQIEAMWQDIMKEYLSFSSKSTWVQAKKSTHYIHLQQPELILEALK